MPLISCPECSSEVSDTALKCTKCGVQLRKPKRGLFGKFAKWGFIGFNILMVLWLVIGVGSASKEMDNLSGAELVGAEIGTGIGVMLIFIIWVVGNIILFPMVLLSRPRT